MIVTLGSDLQIQSSKHVQILQICNLSSSDALKGFLVIKNHHIVLITAIDKLFTQITKRKLKKTYILGHSKKTLT